MIEQKLFGVDQGPDDVFVTLLFVGVGLGFAVVSLGLLTKVIEGQFEFFRIGFAGIDRAVKLADFGRVFAFCVFCQKRRAAVGAGQFVLHILGVQQVQALSQARVLRAFAFA